MAKKNPDPETGVDYEALGRAIDKAFIRDYVHLIGSTRRQMWSAFVRGLMLGFGTVIGGTLIVAALIYLLSIFDTAPVIGDYIERINHAIQTGQPFDSSTPSSK